MTEIGWGQLAQYEAYGRAGDTEEDFTIITYEESKGSSYSSFKHASHAMLFARTDSVLWNLYKARAAVLVICHCIQVYVHVEHYCIKLKREH